MNKLKVVILLLFTLMSGLLVGFLICEKIAEDIIQSEYKRGVKEMSAICAYVTERP